MHKNISSTILATSNVHHRPLTPSEQIQLRRQGRWIIYLSVLFVVGFLFTWATESYFDVDVAAIEEPKCITVGVDASSTRPLCRIY